jgi:hypothetical protein
VVPTGERLGRRTGRFPELVDPRSSVNGLVLTGSPRFRGVSLEERRSLCRLKQSADNIALELEFRRTFALPVSARHAFLLGYRHGKFLQTQGRSPGSSAPSNAATTPDPGTRSQCRAREVARGRGVGPTALDGRQCVDLPRGELELPRGPVSVRLGDMTMRMSDGLDDDVATLLSQGSDIRKHGLRRSLSV